MGGGDQLHRARNQVVDDFNIRFRGIKTSPDFLETPAELVHVEFAQLRAVAGLVNAQQQFAEFEGHRIEPVFAPEVDAVFPPVVRAVGGTELSFEQRIGLSPLHAAGRGHIPRKPERRPGRGSAARLRWDRQT